MKSFLKIFSSLSIALFLAVSAHADDRAIKRRTGTPILQIDTGGHMAKIQDVIFTRDGNYLVSASNDKTIRIWNVKTGQIERVIRGRIGDGNKGKIYAAALSPDNRWLAVGGFMANFDGSNHQEIGKIRLLDFRTGEIIRLFNGHTSTIAALAFSLDSRQLISGSVDKTARIWDVATGNTLSTLSGHAEPIYAAAFSPDGERAVTGSLDDTLILWNVRTGARITQMTGHVDDVASAAFTPDGKYILSGSFDKTIRLWDGKNGKFVKELGRQHTNASSLSVSPDGKRVLTGSGYGSGNTCNIFSIPEGRNLATFTEHKNIVLATAISPDGKLAATGGGNDQEIYLWDIASGKVRQKLVGKGKVVWSVGFGKDGRTVAWGKTQRGHDFFYKAAFEQSFRLSESGEGYALSLGETLSGDTGYIRGVDTVGEISIRTPNGRIHPTLRILENGQVKHEITLGSTDGYQHQSLTLTPDGRIAVSGGAWGVLSAYDTASGNKLRNFIGHTGDVWGVAVSPDGKRLVSGSADQTVRLWDIATGKNLLTIFHATDNEWVAWTPEGYYVSSEKGGRFVGWHLNQGEDRSAEFFTAEQLKATLYRPDLVAAKLKGKTVPEPKKWW